MFNRRRHAEFRLAAGAAGRFSETRRRAPTGPAITQTKPALIDDGNAVKVTPRSPPPLPPPRPKKAQG